MSFIFKQMLNNINTDIEALQLEDINIGIGGAALGESISNLSTALNGEVSRAGTAETLISQNVSYESSRAAAEEYALSQRITTEIAAETTRASNAESSIMSLVSTNIHYGFRAVGTIGVETMAANDICYFNSINTSIGCYCVPNINSFETASYRYIIPINGYYVLGYKLYISVSATTVFNFGIFVNNAIKIESGSTAGMAETMQINIYCEAGDTVFIKCVNGNGSIQMSSPFSQFYGYRIGS